MKRPSLRPLGLFGVKERQYSAQLQIPVEIVHLGVAQRPGYRSTGGEARGRSHFPCLFFSSFPNNSQPPRPDEDTYENKEEKGIRKITKQHYEITAAAYENTQRPAVRCIHMCAFNLYLLAFLVVI